MARTALVTGASSGIGLELARVLAREGCNLILVARSKGRLEVLSAELEREYGITARVIPADLSRPEAVRALYDQTRDVQVDVLVNNAGFGAHGNFAESDWATESSMLQVNIHALTELTRLYLPAMKQRGRGEILNVASTAAYQACPGMAVYGATKAYVLSFTEALAVELRGTGVTVTALCPGATRTAFADRATVGDAPLFQRGVMDAAAVAAAGYAGLRAGKTAVIPGWLNKAMVGMGRLVPRSTLARITSAFLNPVHRGSPIGS